MSSTSRIPSYTEVYTTSPTAAGLPVLEVVRRLEEEKLITKDDRMALKDGLYSSDVVRREEIVKALCEVELSMNSRFSIRRLKAVIHQNGGGEVSSKNQHKLGSTMNSSDLESGQHHAQYTNNPARAMKANSRPSKYRTKPGSYSSPDGGSPSSGGHSPSSPRTSTGTQTTATNYVPSSSGAPHISNNNAPMRLFASPTAQTPMVHSAREKSSHGLPGAPGTAEPPAIHYVNNNVRMHSPKSSRSREDSTSPHRVHANYTPSSSGHTTQSTPIIVGNGNTGTAGVHTAQSSSYSTNSTPQYAPNSGRGQRPSPHRTHAGEGHTTTTSSTAGSHAQGAHHHGGGNINNAQQHQQQQRDAGNGDDDVDNISTINAINQVVGNQPVYSGPECFSNVLAKILVRLKEFYAKYDVATRGRRRLAVLVGGGSFNPLTRMHLRTYFLAKQCLEAKYGYVVLGSLLSPAHGATVRERYRTNPSEIIPSPHRLAVAQLLVQNSKLLSIDPWEITRRRAMDYLSLLDHVASIIKDQIPDTEIKVLFVCKPNMVPKLSPQALRDGGFGVVTVCRTHESDMLRNALTAKWNGVITVVEDTAILDASMDVITSRKVRDKIKLGETVEQLVGEKINDYVQIHKLGLKMNGIEKWEHEEKVLPSLASRPAVPTLTSQFNKLMQSQLQQASIISQSTNPTGEYSPDRLLLPINELTTLNMSAHNNNHPNSMALGGGGGGGGIYGGSSRMAAGKGGVSSMGGNNGGGSGGSGGYMPTWMAESDL